ncbi:hypothetical protein CMV_030298 [Castanea mollissima]|uniref:Uncharacterized protein n=1 Tax=Castanea mollissima TaxID=60419 RepID=A0A8J4VA00_9ROSI|nr:hypothetical protein CMV_030298 [Castanea mollissima]
MKFCHVTNKAKADDVSASRGDSFVVRNANQQEEDDDQNAQGLRGLVHTQAFVTVLIKIGNCIRVRNVDMGSEGPKAVTIHVTGFKKFQGVAENPTETIVSNLKDFVEKRGLPPGATLGSCTILETAGDGALPLLYQTLESCISKTDITSHEQIIWLHLGVNSGAPKFAIEQQAVNEASFRCPDELGWQPQQVPIVSEDGGTTRAREYWFTALHTGERNLNVEFMFMLNVAFGLSTPPSLWWVYLRSSILGIFT